MNIFTASALVIDLRDTVTRQTIIAVTCYIILVLLESRPKKTWKEVVREDCQARKLNKEDAMDRCKWRKMIKEAR